MSRDPELSLRGERVRKLSALREMLPGSFVERRRKCGRPNCRCAGGTDLHLQYQLSFPEQGKLKVVHIPAEWADEVRGGVEAHRRFEQLAATICQINVTRLLRRKRIKPKE